MKLKFFYLHPSTHEIVTLKPEKLISSIANSSGLIPTCIIVKNVSTDILTSIRLHAASLPSQWQLKSAISSPNSEPESSDYVNGVDLTYPELKPNQYFKFYIGSAINSNVGIDFAKLDLDITYATSVISLSNLKAFFEFTESRGSRSVTSTYPSNISASVEDETVITGNGYAYLHDSISIDFNTSSTASISFATKALFGLSDTDNILFTNGNFEFGMDVNRRLYLRLGEVRVVSQKTFNDYNQFHTIGVALKGNQFILTVDGSQVTTDVVFGSASSFSPSAGNMLGGFSSIVIAYFALYGDYKNTAFFNETLKLS
jgi:hypothetical protein